MLAFVLGVGIVNAADDPSVNWPSPSRTATISAPFGDSEIAIRVSSRTAGAINSLTWEGKQFVNSNDHGREFQSASYFENKGGCFNPTEAGSAHDGVGMESTSRLKSLSISRAKLETISQMAYWLGPGETSPDCKGTVSTETSVLSADLLKKTVEIGRYGVPNVVAYDVIFELPENRHNAIFEALTGYMPPEFAEFWAYNPADDVLSSQSDGPGVQTLPLVFSTPDKKYALGVYGLPSADGRPVYGRWKFVNPKMASPTVKWNCLFQNKLVAHGDHTFAVYMLVGTLDDVRVGIKALCHQLDSATCAK